MSNRLKDLSKCWLAACMFLGCLVPAGTAVGNHEPVAGLNERLHQQMGRADFEPAGRPREPFLVVQVDITQDGAVVRSAGIELILGQQKANSTAADLHIESRTNGIVVTGYHVEDPRFSKMEDKRRNVALSAMMRVFVPLSANIDLVTIKPVPGRETIVSAGGAFDPRPLMITACEEVLHTDLAVYFPECDSVLSLMIQ